MQIWRDVDDVPADLGRTVVSIGNFDGVHLGHAHVLREARSTAERLGIPVHRITVAHIIRGGSV